MGDNRGFDQDACNEFKVKAKGLDNPWPSQRLLEAFVGTWEVSGSSKEQTGASEAYGTETYRWLEGKFFLEYRWDRMIAGRRHTGLGVLGWDPDLRSYRTRNFDNLGYFRDYETMIDKGLMTLKGEKERATIVLNASESSLTIDWEFTQDGKTWQSLCQLKGHRVH
jgi:hypothetical protein